MHTSSRKRLYCDERDRAKKKDWLKQTLQKGPGIISCHPQYRTGRMCWRRRSQRRGQGDSLEVGRCHLIWKTEVGF